VQGLRPILHLPVGAPRRRGPLNSNVRPHRTFVHLRFEQVLSVWQEKLVAFVDQCASRKGKVSNRGFARRVRHESRARDFAKFVRHDFGYKNSVASRVAGQKVEFTQGQAQSKTCRVLRFLFVKAYAHSHEYSPTQPVGWHPARPNLSLNGRSNGVPPSLGHRRLLAHFLWPRLGVPPLASPLALR
jgi:hypothetical protein